MSTNYALYFHIPFCTHRCAYCDFNTYAGQEGLIPDYVDALCREIETVASQHLDDYPPIQFSLGEERLLCSPRLNLKTILETVQKYFH